MSVIVMQVPLENGRFLTLELDPKKPFDFAPFQKMNGARIAQNSAPFHSNALSKIANGASAPLSLPERRDNVAILLRAAFSARAGTAGNSPQEELKEAREVLSGKASELALMDHRLAPVRNEETDIRSAIAATHDRRSDDGLILNLGNRGDRVPLFARLDEISRQWGSLKNDRKNLNCEIKILERQIDHIKRSIELASRKKARVA